MVQHSFDLKEAQQSAEVLRMELSIPDAPWETISEVAIRHTRLSRDGRRRPKK